MHPAHCIEIRHFVNVAKCARASVLLIVRFNNFALTTGFSWSYTSTLTQVACSYALLRLVTVIYDLFAVHPD